MDSQSQSISNPNHYKRCARALKELSLQLFSLCLPEQSRVDVVTNWETWRKQVADHLCQAGRVVCLSLRVIQTSCTEVWSNERLCVGGLVGLVALPAWMCHLFFDMHARPEYLQYFYYVNWTFFLNEVRPYLGLIFLATGFFIAAPQKWKFKWWAVPVVVFSYTQIFMMAGYNDWTDFHQWIPAWQIVTVLIVSVPALLFSMNYLLYRKYHLKDGTVARIVGLIEMDMPWADKEVMLKKEAKEYRDFNSRI